MTHPNMHQNPPAGEGILNGHELGRIDQCVADLASAMTQVSTQLLSIGKKQDQWMLRIDQRLIALETQGKNEAGKSRVDYRLKPIGTQTPRRTFASSSTESARAAPASPLDTTQDVDSSDDITDVVRQRKTPSPQRSPPSSPLLAIKAEAEPMAIVQRSHLREPKLGTSCPSSNLIPPHTPPTRAGSMALQSPTGRSIPPHALTPKSAGAPLPNLVHPLPVDHVPPSANRNIPVSNRANGSSAHRGQSAMQSALASTQATERPSMRISNALTASPLASANGNNSATNTEEPSVQPSTAVRVTGAPSQTPKTGLPNAHTEKPSGHASSKGDRGPSADIPFPMSDGDAVLAGPIPDWLPIERSGGNKTPASPKADRISKDTSRAEEEEPENGSFMFMHFSEDDCAPPIDDNVPGRVPTPAERAAAVTACISEDEVREDTPKDGEILSVEQGGYLQSSDLSHDEPMLISKNRDQSAPNSNQPAQRPIQRSINGGIIDPDVIVISSDDEPMPIRSEAIPDGTDVEVKYEPGTSQQGGRQAVSVQPQIQPAVEQPNAALPERYANRSAKRKRSSLPFTNSMSEREQRLEQMRKESQSSSGSYAEHSDSESETSDGDNEDAVFADPNTAFDPDYAPASVQLSQTASAPRPLKIPRLTAPLTEAEAELRVREADKICKTFFWENGGNPAYAVELYTSAANRNSIVGMVRLAAILAKGAVSLGPRTTRVRKNVKSALVWVNKALRLSPEFTEALIVRGDLWMTSNVKRGKAFKNALECYNKAAELGDVLAICRKGELYRTQMFATSSAPRKRKCCQNAIKELELAVEKGCARAASFLGSLFENETQDCAIGEVIRKSKGGECPENRAVELFWFSKDLGSALGTNDAAACYEVAYGPVIGNFDEAKRLYEEAFRMGHLGAAANLALLYELGGKGSFKDRIDGIEALKWYNIGYTMKCPVATYYLGVAYDHGSIRERDPILAERLFVAAINYAEDSGMELDVADRAQGDLFGIRATKVLMRSEGADRAYKAILAHFGKPKGINKMENVQADLAIVVEGHVKAGNQSHAEMVAIANATESAKESLGQRNFGAVERRAKIIMQEIKARRKNNLEVSSTIGPLQSIVGLGGLVRLGL